MGYLLQSLFPRIVFIDDRSILFGCKTNNTGKKSILLITPKERFNAPSFDFSCAVENVESAVISLSLSFPRSCFQTLMTGCLFSFGSGAKLSNNLSKSPEWSLQRTFNKRKLAQDQFLSLLFPNLISPSLELNWRL